MSDEPNFLEYPWEELEMGETRKKTHRYHKVPICIFENLINSVIYFPTHNQRESTVGEWEPLGRHVSGIRK